MNLQIFSKTVLTILIACFAAGGACYEPPRTITSEEMAAADVFTFYRIVEYLREEDGKCVRQVSGLFFSDNKTYELEAPARATFNGAESPVITGVPHQFGCETDRAEFVLTDNQGSTKRDVYGLKKVRFDAPTQIDGARDLRIPIEIDEALNYDFKGTFERDKPGEPIFFGFLQVADEADLAERLNNPAPPKKQAYFLRSGKLLVIPKHLFSSFAPGDLSLSIGIEQRLFKAKTENPADSLRSQAFAYEYSLNPKIKLK